MSTKKFDELLEDYKTSKGPNWDMLESATIKAREMFSKIPGLDVERLEYMFTIGDQVLDHWKEGRQIVIANAPTGFGKSFLAFYVSSIFKHMKSDSYILTPNKFLQEQYASDVTEKKFDDVAMLKGQNNYVCSKNNKRMSERACEDHAINDVMNCKTKYDCASSCAFMLSRKKASESSTTIFNNSYWLTAMYYVLANLGDRAVFQNRGLTILDEAHAMGGIVQNMFTTKFNVNDVVKDGVNIGSLLEFMYRDTAWQRNVWNYLNLMNAQIVLKNEYDFHKDLQMSDFSTVNAAFKTLINEISEVESHIIPYVNRICNDILVANPGIKSSDMKKYASEDQLHILKYAKKLSEQVSGLNQLQNFYIELGIKSMSMSTIKLNEKDYSEIPEFGAHSLNALEFNCANESGVMQHVVVANTNYSLWMSATFGDIDNFAKQSGLTNYGKVYVPQVFDYTKSKIKFIEPLISMNYKNKKENMPNMVSSIIDFVNARPNRRGLIHTGNFEIMRAIKDKRHPRILCYTNSNEKEEIIEILKKRKDVVVCGPSLVEGVDLKDDLCRFMIFCKVPYLSLADELVKRKMLIYDDWYNWVTMSQIEQGLGRGVRNDKDWCETIILDAGFDSFFSRYEAPEYINERLMYVDKSEALKNDPMSIDDLIENKPKFQLLEKPAEEVKEENVWDMFE